MELQEIFDRAVTGVIGQGRPSGTLGGGCFYRLNSNRNDEVKCAVGWLIPDDQYTSRMEGSIDQLFAEWPQASEVLGGRTPEKQSLMEGLQAAHDNSLCGAINKISANNTSAFIEIFVTEAREVAKVYYLSTAALDCAYKAYNDRAA